MNGMDHYVCNGGCGGVSHAAGVCQAGACPRKGKALEPCSCADGAHGWKKKKEDEEIKNRR